MKPNEPKTIKGTFYLHKISGGYVASIIFDPVLNSLARCDGSATTIPEAIDNLKNELINNKEIMEF